MSAEPAVTSDDAAERRAVREPVRGGWIGRYRLGQIIGRGGTSVVYRAEPDPAGPVDPDRSAAVAVKVAHADRSADAAFRRQFLDQARAAVLVDHPGVLPVVDSGQDGDQPFVVMPHVRGDDLARRLQARSLPLGRVLTLLREVADALDAMHAKGVLHLDVKPSNVLVGRHTSDPAADGNGAVDRAFLTDLGLCRFLADGPVPGAADFVGSPRYASPEHLRGRAVRASSDVYSLSCVLFAALAGRPPYIGDIPAVVTGHLSGMVPSVSALAGVPRRLDRVIRRGMHPDPGSRFAVCRDLLNSAMAALDPTPA
ncbi:serine/threonine-protein kinase [Nakamurella sp. GG22]